MKKWKIYFKYDYSLNIKGTYLLYSDMYIKYYSQVKTFIFVQEFLKSRNSKLKFV